MTRSVRFVLVSICLLVVGGTVDAKKNKSSGPLSFREISLRIIDTLEAFAPAAATEMGSHAYDSKLADYSPTSITRMIGSLQKLQTKLNAYDTAKLNASEKINALLLNSNLDIAILNLKGIAWYKRSPYLYVDEAIDGLYFLMLSRHATTGAKMASILGRIGEVPSLFATAQRNLKSPPRVYIESAQEGLKTGRDFYLAVGRQLTDSFPGRAGEIASAVKKAVDAMDNFSAFLSKINPGSDNSFAIGKVNYDYMLTHQYFLPYDSDSLLKIGESLLKQAQADYAEYQEYVDANKQNGQDSVYIPKNFTRADLLDYYNWEVNQVKTFLEINDILTVPDDIAECIVVETPVFLRPMIGGIAYQPAGPYDDNQQGMFYVRPVPDSLDRVQLEARYRYVHRRGFRGSVVHEAFPGHHLQMQLAGHNIDPVRKWQMNNQIIEGWALYCEEMMYNAGLYGDEDPAQWLGVLGGIRFRAARIIADVKLHTGQFTYDQCVDWMCKTLESKSVSDSNYIRTEVRRYTHEPTQPMCYLTGKREIQRLFDAYSEKQGVNFSEKDFYDALLAEGSIPPSLFWRIWDLKPTDVE
jgi:uncharacterized protein (DUF885 family)